MGFCKIDLVISNHFFSVVWLFSLQIQVLTCGVCFMLQGTHVCTQAGVYVLQWKSIPLSASLSSRPPSKAKILYFYEVLLGKHFKWVHLHFRYMGGVWKSKSFLFVLSLFYYLEVRCLVSSRHIVAFHSSVLRHRVVTPLHPVRTLASQKSPDDIN